MPPKTILIQDMKQRRLKAPALQEEYLRKVKYYYRNIGKDDII